MRDPFDVPCPPWCRFPANHGLGLADRDVGGIARRVHLSVPDARGRELEQFETVAADGSAATEPACVTAEGGRIPVDGLAVLLGRVTG